MDAGTQTDGADRGSRHDRDHRSCKTGWRLCRILSGAMQLHHKTVPEKTVDVYLEMPPVKFSYLKQFDRISQDADTGKQYDLCICLDSGDRERLGKNVVYLDTAKSSICIDHHITNQGYAQENFVNADASAACEFLYDFLDEEKISREVAECIYTAFFTIRMYLKTAIQPSGPCR